MNVVFSPGFHQRHLFKKDLDFFDDIVNKYLYGELRQKPKLFSCIKSEI